ncbi:hypothetical protein [Devosia naphthalenivorans]|uniref:hypothetical protein n=1 Tax=Devosia naphthalenivorans TaxID=2082392 RepID=UPI0013B06112|nr:hypothetical protein [Devosia naphthalenivorans]
MLEQYHWFTELAIDQTGCARPGDDAGIGSERRHPAGLHLRLVLGYDPSRLECGLQVALVIANEAHQHHQRLQLPFWRLARRYWTLPHLIAPASDVPTAPKENIARKRV